MWSPQRNDVARGLGASREHHAQVVFPHCKHRAFLLDVMPAVIVAVLHARRAAVAQELGAGLLIHVS